MHKLLQIYRGFKPFTGREAWTIFRLAAFAEGIGWLLLIIGIAISRYLTPGNNIAVQIAGQCHGTLFLLYLAASILTAPSQDWSIVRVLAAAAASVPPFGSIIFEQWEVRRRYRLHWHRQLRLHIYWRILTSS